MLALSILFRYHLPLEKTSLPPFNPLALNLAAPSSAPSSSVSPMNATNPNDHRISCHRCGNIRKRKTVCSRANCPHTFCGRCSDKLRLEYGPEVFSNGCPVCKDLCCCSNKSVNCTRKFHCKWIHDCYRLLFSFLFNRLSKVSSNKNYEFENLLTCFHGIFPKCLCYDYAFQ